MAKFTVYHNTESWELLETISSELASFGLTIVDKSPEGGEFAEYEIEVLK